MDLTNVDIAALTKQLRKPEGALGEEVGSVMAQYNAPANAFVFTCLQVQPTDHVLEIGFGPGEGIAEAVRLTPKGFVGGIDHSETMLQLAEKRNHRAIMQERVELTLGTASELPYKDGSFDKIFSVNVFHFWTDPSRELSECLRVLKPGGKAVFYVVHPSSWPPGFAESGVFIKRMPEEIKHLLQLAEFNTVEARVHTFEGGTGCAVIGTK